MASGIQGTGLYSQLRWRTDALRADRQHLKNAPLSDRARLRLEKSIEQTEAEVKEIRRKIREEKAQRGT